MFAYNWDRKSCPLYGVERWPQNRGFLSTILNGDAVGTKVSVHHRQGSRSSEVVVKRGSTVDYTSLLSPFTIVLHLFFRASMFANNALLGGGVGLGFGLENKERSKGDQKHY